MQAAVIPCTHFDTRNVTALEASRGSVEWNMSDMAPASCFCVLTLNELHHSASFVRNLITVGISIVLLICRIVIAQLLKLIF